MNRRALLRASAAAGALLAGCLETGDDPGDAGTAGGGGSPTGTTGRSPTGTENGGSGGDGADGDDDATTDEPTDESTDDEPTDGSTDTETASDDDTPTETDGGTETPDGSDGSNELVDRSFEVGGTECGQGANRAAVSRGDDRVDVDGTITGRNGCYTAELEDATYDEESDELRIAVSAYDDSDEYEGCQQCIVDVDYRATFEFRDGTPEEVTVFHDGEHVTTG